VSALAERDATSWRRAPGGGKQGWYRGQDVPVEYFQQRLSELIARGTSKGQVCRRMGGHFVGEIAKIDLLDQTIGLKPYPSNGRYRRARRHVTYETARRLADAIEIDPSPWPSGARVPVAAFHAAYRSDLDAGLSKGAICRRLGGNFLRTGPRLYQLDWTIGLRPYPADGGSAARVATRVRYETAVRLAFAMRMGPEAAESPDDELARLIAEQEADELCGDRIWQPDLSLQTGLGNAPPRTLGDALEAL